MRILHTADWHLGDRLGRIDRTEELRKAVECVARLCAEHRVDVLVVAGDLFSELSRADTLRGSVEHLAATFRPFLTGGGTILAVTGNHDNETFCQTLRHVLSLAAPEHVEPGRLVPPGRFYLAAEPTLLRLAGRAGQTAQFALMPYPTPTRYFEGTPRRYQTYEEKNQALAAAFAARLDALRQPPVFDPAVPAVLVAHVHAAGAVLSGLFRITERESIVVPDDGLAAGWAYVALGHIHRPQRLRGLPHVRYPGAIARLDLGECTNGTGVVLAEIGAAGCRGEPVWLPVASRPVYEVVVTNPAEEVVRLPDRYPDAADALVRLHVVYEAGKDVLNEVLARLEAVFPRWYDRTWQEVGELPRPADAPASRAHAGGFRDTVLAYLDAQLAESRDREELLRLAEDLLEEEQPA
jgi:exonuclease SbcD